MLPKKNTQGTYLNQFGLVMVGSMIMFISNFKFAVKVNPKTAATTFSLDVAFIGFHLGFQGSV